MGIGAAAGTGYGTIAAQMVLLGTGMGLTGAPATEAIMGVVPRAQTGVGSAVNDATRLLGGTLGVAVIGSVYGSLYAGRLTSALLGGLPAAVARTAHRSLGAALDAAGELTLAGRAGPAAGVAAAGVLLALALLPSHPTAPTGGTPEPQAQRAPVTAPA